jgi:hypothetical protein
LSESVLENTKTVDHWLRVLYVPPGISWDTMWEHGVKLFKSGHKVQIHEHRWQERCPVLDTDGSVKRCGQLTDDGDGPRLVLASQGPAPGAPGTIES